MSCARRAVSGPRCLHHESTRKLVEDGISSDPSQTATATSTILIARAKVHAEVHTSMQSASVLLAVAHLQPPRLRAR
ncbi:hypothetical protein EAF00_001525 [Botryotinia globosa]|nr:hypothetical protein EAF00_001525 [Botryotinia globosa]